MQAVVVVGYAIGALIGTCIAAFCLGVLWGFACKWFALGASLVQ
jgi:hypothetical protein